jgi:hypothetical protein
MDNFIAPVHLAGQNIWIEVNYGADAIEGYVEAMIGLVPGAGLTVDLDDGQALEFGATRPNQGDPPGESPGTSGSGSSSSSSGSESGRSTV